MSGRVFETYVAALQHDLADIPEDATRIGVVRRPTPWFYGTVDENRPALGPPPGLLDETQARRDELEAEGLSDADAHNQAMTDIDFTARYEDYLQTDPDAQAALEDIRGMLADGEDVALVCYENTDDKRCHRTTLRDHLDNGSE